MSQGTLSDVLARLAAHYAPPPAAEDDEVDEQYVLLEFDGISADELHGDLSLQVRKRPWSSHEGCIGIPN